MKNSHADAKAIYPDIIPPAVDHPTFDHFEIVQSGDGRGRGLRSRIAFKAGEKVAQLSGVLTRSEALDTIQISKTLNLHDPWFCRFLLHSCDPNLQIEIATLKLFARKPVSPGDYMSIDYTETEDVLSGQFACSCGSPNCRGWIYGKSETPNDEGRRLLSQRQMHSVI